MVAPPDNSSTDDARRAFGDDGSGDPLPGPPQWDRPRGPGPGRDTEGDRDRRKADWTPPRGERWIPLVVAALALVATGLGLWRAERAALRDPVEQGRRGEVVRAEGRSLLREANLQRVFAKVAARLDDDEVVTDVDLSPVRAVIEVRDAEGHERTFGVDLAYDVVEARTGTNAAPGPALSRLDPGAPGRLVLAALSTTGPAARIVRVDWRYAANQEQQSWDLTLEEVPIADQHWTADATGTRSRRAGDPEPVAPPLGEPIPTTSTTPAATPAPTPTTPVRPTTRPGTQVRIPPESNVVVVRVGGTTIVTDPAAGRRLNRCLRRAGNRPARLQACVDALGR
ncbi:hypothetical protein DSM112329_00439 [Paraconexibacter sp. AEG42_29]|uniref:Uncharacterized protein n=1 Tax=Paraconexibacter sp. AEG42_29 TaxID=2997339 RepID=A0AAU7APT2_9ACTN